MSSTTPISTQVTSSLPSASASSRPAQSDGNNSVNFYRNLFYILIGLLGVFALISILSLLRARHRRKLIHAEAVRLGVLVPGMDGYVSMRDRRAARQGPNGRSGAVDTTHPPDWWEVGAGGWMKAWLRPSALSRGYSGISQSGANFGFTSLSMPSSSKSPYTDETDHLDLYSEKPSHFSPLAIIPPQPEDPADAPLPISTLKYFPVNSAYRPEDLLPPPLVWGGEGMSAAQLNMQVEALSGDRVDVVTMIRMPETPEQVEMRERAVRRARMGSGVEEEEDGEEVLREWGGVCLGVIRMGVGSEEDSPGAYRREGPGRTADGHGRDA